MSAASRATWASWPNRRSAKSTRLLHMLLACHRIGDERSHGGDGGVGSGVETGLTEERFEVGGHHGGHTRRDRLEDGATEGFGEVGVMEVHECVEAGQELLRGDRAERQHLPVPGHFAEQPRRGIGASEDADPHAAVHRVGSADLIGGCGPLAGVGPAVAPDHETRIDRVAR